MMRHTVFFGWVLGTLLFLMGPTAVGAARVSLEGVSASEMDERGREALDHMRQVLSRVLEIHQRARESRDVVKLNCVNEKLIAVKGLLKISENAYGGLQESLVQKQMNNARHEYRKIVTARKNCAQLAGESETCVGEFAVYSGDTDVQLDVNTTLVGSDQLALGSNLEEILEVPTELIEPPPAASGYQ
jgi:hypothetical protein